MAIPQEPSQLCHEEDIADETKGNSQPLLICQQQH